MTKIEIKKYTIIIFKMVKSGGVGGGEVSGMKKKIGTRKAMINLHSYEANQNPESEHSVNKQKS